MSELRTQPLPALAPPRPHDPGDRALVEELGPWEIRVFPWNDPRHRWMVGRGLLHLQLWCPEAPVSVLTRSRLTRGRFEVWRPNKLVRICCPHQLARTLEREIGLPAPCQGALQHLERTWVWTPSIGVAPVVDRSRC